MNQDEHLQWIRRLLRGEAINGEVGIRVRGGPSDGKIRIMRLDEQGLPPPQTRRRQSDGLAQVYRLKPDPNERTGWIYEFDGLEAIDAT